MALVESTQLTIGKPLPAFALPAPDGTQYSSDKMMGSTGLVIIFTCNHCPYAIAIWPRLIQLFDYAKAQGVNMIAVNPNIHPDYPDDAPEKMADKIKQWQIPFPYLVDQTQEVARQYQAQCTPDIYLLDSNHHLAYHGRLDDNWKNPENVTRTDLKDAITQLSLKKQPLTPQYPSMGCSIKWQD